MKKLHNKVNIVPLIAKSDILTKQECKKLKDKVTFIIVPLIAKSDILTKQECKKLKDKVNFHFGKCSRFQMLSTCCSQIKCWL